jgi:hypothetical protein
MDQATAQQLAEILGGEAWHSGGGVWLVLLDRSDGALIALSDECASVYPSRDALASGDEPERSVVFHTCLPPPCCGGSGCPLCDGARALIREGEDDRQQRDWNPDDDDAPNPPGRSPG